MCVVLPVDHITCNHTVATWQHCINAVRSLYGVQPCSQIRQHARPVLTRKLCVHCGGPHCLARRGGIAARGNGTSAVAEKRESGSPYDSGYCSEVIHQEEEEGYETDSTLSPKAARMPMRRWQTVSRQSSSSTRRTHSRTSSWQPNLKKELTRRISIDSITSAYSKESSTYDSRSSKAIESSERSTSPILRRTLSNRKNSTLLHPSSPVDSATDDQYAREFTMGELTPPVTAPPRPLPPEQQDLSLKDNIDAEPFVSILALPTPITAEPLALSTSVPLLRPPISPRKPSTLLHPRPCDDVPPNIQILSLSSTGTESERPTFAFPTFTETPPTPLPTKSLFQRRASVLHSALSDDEWEEPLHSSQSDVDYESDDQGYGADTDTESFDGPAVMEAVVEVAAVVRSGRISRASRISFHGQSLRLLE